MVTSPANESGLGRSRGDPMRSPRGGGLSSSASTLAAGLLRPQHAPELLLKAGDEGLAAQRPPGPLVAPQQAQRLRR